MMIKKPIFIVGTGRSGTTAFNDIFCRHSQLSWTSDSLNSWPDKPLINKLVVKSAKLPIAGDLLRRRYPPSEAYPFWNNCYLGFSEPCRDLVSADVSPHIKQQFHSQVKKLMVPGRDRFIAKITGWPRLGFINEVFPDSKFIYVLRDGRAVANSLLNIWFWRGWKGPQNWRWGALSDEQQNTWENNDRSYFTLAGIQWNILVEAFEKAQANLSNKSLIVKYEDFCHDKYQTMQRSCEFSELQYEQAFHYQVDKFPVRSTNQKWRDGLTGLQQEQLTTVMEKNLLKYGYEL